MKHHQIIPTQVLHYQGDSQKLNNAKNEEGKLRHPPA